MNISLTPELEALISEKVRSGDYNSASEVVRAALRMLKEQDELNKYAAKNCAAKPSRASRKSEASRGSVYNSAEELAASVIRGGRVGSATK